MSSKRSIGRDADCVVLRGAAAPASRVVLAGRPGAGKGTQGRLLAQRLRVQHLSTGDLLRREITAGSALGNAIERLVTAGRLLPTGLIVAIVETHLDHRGYVLDGFPRTVAQAELLFERAPLAPTIAIELVVPAPIALARLTTRGRSDDDPAVARERLATYDTETLPTLDWLDRRGLLVRVDGHDTPDAVARTLWDTVRHSRSHHDRADPHEERIITLTADPPGAIATNRQHASE